MDIVCVQMCTSQRWEPMPLLQKKPTEKAYVHASKHALCYDQANTRVENTKHVCTHLCEKGWRIGVSPLNKISDHHHQGSRFIRCSCISAHKTIVMFFSVFVFCFFEDFFVVYDF